MTFITCLSVASFFTTPWKIFFARAEADAEIASLKAQLEKAKIAANPVVMRFQAEFERFGESYNKMKKLIDECGLLEEYLTDYPYPFE